MLGKDDLGALLIEQGEITVDCEFCGHRYGYDASAVARLMGQIDEIAGATNDPLH